MRKSTWPYGLTGSVACLVLLTACGVPGQQPLMQPPVGQQTTYQQPAITQQPSQQTVANLYPNERWGRAHTLIDQAATAVKDGRTNDAFNLINQAKDSFISETKQISASDPNALALRQMIDSSLQTISTTTQNVREVTSILTDHLKDAFVEISRRAQGS